MANIALIAEKAGVSIATVSRTLRNTNRLTTPNQRRIVEIAKRLGYDFECRSSDAAVKTRQIVFLSCVNTLSPETVYAHDTYMPVVNGITRIINRYGYDLLVANVDLDENPPPCLLRKNIDGVIFHGLLSENFMARYVQNFHHVGIQHLNPDFDCSWVKLDNENLGYQMVKRLYRLGHRRIGFIADYIEDDVTRERYNGYLKAMRNCGIEPDPAWSAVWQRQRVNGVLPKEATVPDYSARIREIITRPAPPTAFYCTDTIKSEATRNALQAIGMKVPEDVSIVTVCNDFSVRNPEFVWTAVNDRFPDICSQAAQLLMDTINGKAVENITMLLRPGWHEGHTLVPVKA
jgi:DNA-binding LacI/PurR family transcriptional regulator